MQTAYCKLDNANYFSQQFFALPPDEITAKRYYLVCSVCGGHAFFRWQTRNGREACFGAYHSEGCQMAAIQTAIDTNRQSQSRDASSNQEQHIVVDFAYGAIQSEGHASRPETPSQLDDGRHSGGASVRQNIVSHRRPSSILRDLISLPGFCNSNQIVYVAGCGETTVANFFVPFNRLSYEHRGCFMGYWGRLTCAKDGYPPALWLNTGMPGDLSILVPYHLANALRSRFGIEDRGDLTAAGMYVLVFGTLHISISGKPYIEIADLCSITMCNPPSH